MTGIKYKVLNDYFGEYSEQGDCFNHGITFIYDDDIC